jgi:hypothetical protein
VSDARGSGREADGGGDVVTDLERGLQNSELGGRGATSPFRWSARAGVPVALREMLPETAVVNGSGAQQGLEMGGRERRGGEDGRDG